MVLAIKSQPAVQVTPEGTRRCCTRRRSTCPPEEVPKDEAVSDLGPDSAAVREATRAGEDSQGAQ